MLKLKKAKEEKKMKSSKVFRTITLILIFVAALTVPLTSCNFESVLPTDAPNHAEASKPTNSMSSDNATAVGDKGTDSHVHAWSDWEITVESTCTLSGEESRSCPCGEQETRSLELKDHNYIPAVTDPTCLTKGYTTYTCDCGDSYVDNYTFEAPTDSDSDSVCDICGIAAGLYDDKGNLIAPWNELDTADISDGTQLIIGNVETINIKAFENCSTLKKVVIPGSVKNIFPKAFYSCSSLSDLIIGNGVEQIYDHAFAHCTSLTNVIIPDSVTALQRWVFENCTSLKQVEIGSGVVIIGAATFSGCSSLTSIILPDNVSSIGYGLFEDCSALKSVTLGKGITYIATSAFSGCSSLIEVIISGQVTSIHDYAFWNCNSITEIVLPNTVTLIETNAFEGCAKLSKINIPRSVDEIAHYAFSGCTNLNAITFEGTKSEWGKIKLCYGWNDNVPATEVICSDGTVYLS